MKNQALAKEKKELPDELITDIALRLPAKTIALFKCVSKPCNLTFSSSDFVESYARRTPERLIFGVMNKSSPSVATLSHHGGAVEESREIQNPIFGNNKFKIPEPVNCCHGLVLLRLRKEDRRDVSVLAVINPITSKGFLVPESYQYGDEMTCLGYSQIDDDYKILLLRGVNHPYNYEKFVSVFSLKTRRFKQLEDFESPWIPNRPGVYVDGHIYWLAGDHLDLFIVAFDLSTETYKEMAPPTGFKVEFAFLATRSDVLTKIVELGGCLSIVSHDAGGRWAGKPIDFWIMEKSGSWRKFTIANYPSIRTVQMKGSIHYSIVSRVGESKFLLVKTNGELVGYDCETREWWDVDTKGLFLGRVLSFKEKLSSMSAIQ